MHGLLPRNPSGQVALGGDKEKEGERPQRTARKNPNHKRLGSSTTAPLAPFPSKGSPVENQAGFLARGAYLLSAPSQGSIPQWHPQISFRLQLRGSDGFAPSSLLTASDCEAARLFSTNKLYAVLYRDLWHAVKNKWTVFVVRTRTPLAHREPHGSASTQLLMGYTPKTGGDPCDCSIVYLCTCTVLRNPSTQCSQL